MFVEILGGLKKIFRKSALIKCGSLLGTILLLVGGVKLANERFINHTMAEFVGFFPAVIVTFLPNVDSFSFVPSLPRDAMPEDDGFSYIPNMEVQGLFHVNYRFPLHRRIGRETIYLGDLRADVGFSGLERVELPASVMSWGLSAIWYPSIEWEESDDWDPFWRLKELPEQTMVEVYLSFTELMTFEEAFNLSKGRSLSLDWFAVYSGSEWSHARIGFPHNNHHNQLRWQLPSHVWASVSGDFYQQRVEEFVNTIEFLEGNAHLMRYFPMLEFGGGRTAFWNVDFKAILAEFEENGVRIPGVVMTGPTSEILKLQDEPWIRHVEVNHVTILDWHEWEMVE